MLSFTKTAGCVAIACTTFAGSAMGQTALEAFRLDLAASEMNSKAFNGFTIASNDGRTTMRVDGLLQFRYIATFDADQGDESNDAQGFQAQRTRFGFAGRFAGEKTGYRVMTQINADGSFNLLDAFFTYQITDELRVRAGQIMLPFDRERSRTAPTRTLATDRSIVDNVFNLDRAGGVELQYSTDSFRIAGAFSNGRRALNNSYNSDNVADYALSARAELKLGEAKWSQFNQQTSFWGDAGGVLIGAGVHFQEKGNIPVPQDVDEASRYLGYTGDIGYQGNGWSILGVFQGRTIDTSEGSFSDYGFMVQGGVAVSDNADIFARYAMLIPDDDRAGGRNEFSAVTFGANYYFIPKSQTVKLTGEIFWYPTASDDSRSIIRAPVNGSGLLRDDDGGQIGFMLQMQIMF